MEIAKQVVNLLGACIVTARVSDDLTHVQESLLQQIGKRYIYDMTLVQHCLLSKWHVFGSLKWSRFRNRVHKIFVVRTQYQAEKWILIEANQHWKNVWSFVVRRWRPTSTNLELMIMRHFSFLRVFIDNSSIYDMVFSFFCYYWGKVLS